tara:strand:- start:2162 stop:3085 length:924 start_codon:yes stop_codon:yes gene_type:complete
MSVILLSRPDRLGSNFISKISQLIYAHKNKLYVIQEHEHHKIPIHQTYNWRCKKAYWLDSLFIKSIIHTSNIFNKNIRKTKTINNFFNSKHYDLNAIQIDTILNIQQDLYSYFNKHLKSIMFQYIKNNIPKYNLPKNKYICLHIRLGDLKDKINNDTNNIDHYINFYINKINNPNNISIHEYLNQFGLKWNKRLEYQSAISLDKIKKNIEFVKKQYPTYDIIIVSEPHTKSLIKLDYPIISNRNIDLDLWVMINSNVLITSKSSFSLIAAFFHQGEKIFFEKWSHFICGGLKSKYDKSEDLINYECL